MKKYLILTLLGSVSFSLQSMIPSNFSAMPLDMKKEITSHLLDQDKILDVFKSLDSLRRVDKAFYKTLSSYEKLKPFFDLMNAKTLWQAFDVIKQNRLLFKQYDDLGQYFTKKFGYITAQQYDTITPLLLDKIRKSQMKNLLLGSRKSPEKFLFETIKHGDMNLFITCIVLGVDINKFLDQYNSTPLMFAAQNNNASMVKLLLETGADTDKTNKLGISFYELAAGKPEIEKLLEQYRNIIKN